MLFDVSFFNTAARACKQYQDVAKYGKEQSAEQAPIGHVLVGYRDLHVTEGILLDTPA